MNFQNTKNSDFNEEKPHIFDPSVEVKNILKLPSNERKLALENFYKNLEKYHADLVGVFDYARTEFGDLDLSDKTDEEIDIEIEKFLKKFGEKIQNFDENAKNKILNWVAKYVENKKNAYKKLKEFEENPLKFLQENGFKGEGLDEIEGKIEVDEYRGNVVIYVDRIDEELFQGGRITEGWYSENNVILVKRDFSREDKNIDILIHENQHSENKIFLSDMYDEIDKNFLIIRSDREKIKEMIDKKWIKNFSDEDWEFEENFSNKFYATRMENFLIHFKDEILAQIKGGTKVEDLSLTMFHGYNFLEWLKWDTSREYDKMRTEYLQKIEKYVFEAKKLTQKGISVDILAITPLEKWGRLLKSIEKNSLKSSENIWENFIFENIENLENGNFFAKKIFENGEIWEGIFDKNKRFLEWKKIIGDEIQEWKFFQENAKNRGENNENLSFGIFRDNFVTLYGEFFEDGKLLKNGFAMPKDVKIFSEYKNGEPVALLFDGKLEEENNVFFASKINFHKNGVVVAEKWNFIYENGEWKVENGVISITKTASEKLQEFAKRFHLEKIFYKLYNFFPRNQIKFEVKNGEIDRSGREGDIVEFARVNDFSGIYDILKKYTRETTQKQNIFKSLISKILQK